MKGIVLPTGYYFGISATTGDLSDNHDIISIRLLELDLLDDPRDLEDRSNVMPSAAFFEAPRGKTKIFQIPCFNAMYVFEIFCHL